MKDEELRKIWNSTNKEIDTFLNVDEQSLETIQLKKARAKLRSLLLPKLVGIILGMGWMSFMVLLIYLALTHSTNSLGLFFFVGSIGLILVSTSVGVFLYVKDMILIFKIDHSKSITDTQQKLISLQISTLKSIRILWVQLPFYSTWYINYNMIAHGNIIFWTIQLFVTGFLIGIVIWMYRILNYQNKDSKWVRYLTQGYGFDSIQQAMDFIKEIDEFKETK